MIKYKKTKQTFLWCLPAMLLIACLLIGNCFVNPSLLKINLQARFLPPGSRYPDGSFSLLGTDHLGRDLFSQILAGAPLSFLVSSASVFLAMVIGSFAGLTAGFWGRKIDLLIMRLVDMQLGFPPLLLAIILGGVLGPSIRTLVISLTAVRWTTFARLARNLAIRFKAEQFVEAARAVGASNTRIILYHILPNALGQIVILATSQFGLQILAEAALSFLGFGIIRPQISWGLLINEGKPYLITAWWISTFPGLILLFVVLSVSLAGDAIQDYISKKL